MMEQQLRNVEVSIHAPARGATTKSRGQIAQEQFQSTLPHEERHADWRCRKVGWLKFQSTLPHEERHETYKEYDFIVMFQSTLPHEERRFIYFKAVQRIQFQSTLPHEERLF